MCVAGTILSVFNSSYINYYVTKSEQEANKYKEKLEILYLSRYHGNKGPPAAVPSGHFIPTLVIIQYDSRDHKGLGVAHEKTSPKNQLPDDDEAVLVR